MMDGLSTINIELTNRCNKNCWCCGRRLRENKTSDSDIYNKDIDFDLLESIAMQLPKNIVVQLHNNGEPTLYPKLGKAIELFENQITAFNTNGKLLLEKSEEIINNLDLLTISVIENDPESEEQFEIIKEFISIKSDRKPMVNIRCLGNVDVDKYRPYGQIVKRILHSPNGSYDYEKEVTLPEIGVCLDLLHHMSISCEGKVSICVRFDPFEDGVIGDCNKDSLSSIWYSDKRKRYIRLHMKGFRSLIALCMNCEYYGVPKGN